MTFSAKSNDTNTNKLEFTGKISLEFHFNSSLLL